MVSKCFLRFDRAPSHVTFPCCVPIAPCLGNRSKICKWRQINTGMCRRRVTCHFTLQFLFKNKYWWKTFVTIFGATFARISMTICFETFLRTQAQQMLKEKWKFIILTIMMRNENDNRDGDDDGADKVPSPLPHEFLRWDMQHGEGITHTYHSPRPLYISISISKIVSRKSHSQLRYFHQNMCCFAKWNGEIVIFLRRPFCYSDCVHQFLSPSSHPIPPPTGPYLGFY